MIYNYNSIYWTELGQYFQWLIDNDIPFTTNSLLYNINTFLCSVKGKYKSSTLRSKKSRLFKSILIYYHLLYY